VVFELSSVLASARAKEGLEDYGDPVFLEPLGVLLDSYACAPLNELGSRILRGDVVHSLRMRLRLVEWFRRHPEIADEKIVAPVVVVGMMRSGTTLVQRLLAADPSLMCAYGWEVRQVAPPLDLDWSVEDPRIATGIAQEEQARTWLPELFAIHPMHALEAEEEIVFLADAFLSHVPESGAQVPDYRSWLDSQDFTPAYEHLHRVLQLLQWQKRRRGETASRWVLKTPAHLGYLDTLRAQFPDLHLVHLHRDPRETIPSGASLNATLHAMHADVVDPHVLGSQWIERMGWTNDRALVSRATWGPATDLEFREVVADPIGQVARVYDGMGLPFEAEAPMREWLSSRPHEPGARPAYDAATFGLSDAQIDARFAAYNERFRS
jgi:hypothetical protein